MRARLLVCALVLAGCAERTSIVLRVTSDFVAPEEIDGLTIEVAGADSGAMLNEIIGLTRDFPHEYRVFPHSDFPGEAVTITVTGTLVGDFVVRQSAQSGFVSGAHRRVEMRLHRACMGLTLCAPGVPCNESGMCMGGVADCDMNEDCADAFSCTVDTCQGGVCIREPMDELCPADTVCHETQGCAPACSDDASCGDEMFCNGVETCVADHCLFATREACNDSDICTTDTCDEATDTCGTEQPQELCNGMDDDCDGACDNGFECCQNSVAGCTTSCGTMGTALCGESCTLRTCEPPAEQCNGADDDCNGRCDDGFECCRGMASCTTSCGSIGTATCDDACTQGACAPPAETCNGMDDDCDGACDNGFACCGGVPSPCRTSCDPAGEETGTQNCDDTCALMGACTPPAEDCTNMRDDDCDSDTDCSDNDCTGTPACMVGGCTECTSELAVATPGGRRSVTLGADNHMGSCGGGGGSEAYITFTVAEPTDVFATTHGAGVDTVLYLRSGSSCCGTEVACNDDANGMNTSVLRANVPAGTYHLIVDTKASMSRSIPIDIFLEAPGPGGMGDRCANPIFIAPGATQVIGSTGGNGNDYRAVGAAGTTCPDTVTPTSCDRAYYFYLPTATTVTFDGCGADAAHSYDQLAYIRSVCTDASSGSQLGCGDDCDNPTVQCNNGRRNASVTATIGPGLFYFIADGWCSGACDLASPCFCGGFDYTVSGL